MRQLLLAILLSLGSLTWAANPLKPLMAMLEDLKGHPELVEQTDAHIRIRMADSCYYDIYPTGDSIVLIQTVCAPICSSCVRVYNKEWEFTHAVSPACSGIFPEATFRDGRIYWHDNTSEFLDDEEKKRLE